MVATRNHPREFPEPDSAVSTDSTRKRTTRTSTSNHASPTKAAGSPTPIPRTTRRASKSGWSHTPSNLTLIWLAVSLPLVVWDTGYVLLRPYSMPGGALHKPIWSPYALYGEVDYVYGMKAVLARNGWTAAQASVNAIETFAYLVYLYLVYVQGEQEPRQGSGAPDKSAMGRLRALSESRTVYGSTAAYASVLAYSIAQVTFWKTILYWLTEAFSGFANIGHNSFSSLVFLWIIPNVLWIIFPGYMIYVFGKEIVEGLEIATQSKRSR